MKERLRRKTNSQILIWKFQLVRKKSSKVEHDELVTSAIGNGSHGM